MEPMNNIELTLPNNSILEFQPGLPPDYSGPLLRGSTAVSTKTNLAEVVLQQLTGVDYFIRLSSGRLLKKISAKGWATQYGLYSNFILKNDARKELKGCIAPVSILESPGKGFKSRIAFENLMGLVFPVLDQNKQFFITIKSQSNAKPNLG